MTNVNNPNVRIVIGSVSTTRTGLMNMFRTPKTTATINAVVTSAWMPGTIKAAIYTANVLMIRFISSFII